VIEFRHVDFSIDGNPILRDVSFTVARGQTTVILGPSGSGKSTILRLLLGLYRPDAGSIFVDGVDVTGIGAARWREIRSRMGMVFQQGALFDSMTVGENVGYALLEANGDDEVEVEPAVRHYLELVGLDPYLIDRMPDQLSGGMRQRVMIAMALACRPALLIADEPTTALDVTIQAQILFEAQKLCAETGTAMIWITHDLTVVAGLADNIAVMYAGKIVEQGSVDQILDDPLHPYTHGLIGSVPGRNRRGKRLEQIPGMTPSLMNLPPGCAFRQRCLHASDACRQPPPLAAKNNGRKVRCFHPVRDLA